MSEPVKDAVCEAMRRSHCSHPSAMAPDHGCAGSLTITANGIKLACVLCGNSDETRSVPYSIAGREMVQARRVVAAAGLDWRALTVDTQIAVIRALGDKQP